MLDVRDKESDTTCFQDFNDSSVSMTVGHELYVKILSLELHKSWLLLVFKSPVNLAPPVVVYPIISGLVSNRNHA